MATPPHAEAWDTGKPLGLIAGGGRLPVLVAEGARAAGRRVVGVGLAGQYAAEVPGVCERFAEVGVLRIGQWARRLRGFGARRAIMVGGVSKGGLMYMHPVRRVWTMRPDWRAARLWYGVLRHDRRSQTMLAGIADELERAGVTLMNSTLYIGEQMATAGTLGAVQPTARQRADIELGWPILMRMNELEVGQAIAVRGGDVVAVEAIEGTDRMIVRAGELAGENSGGGGGSGGWVLLKGAGPGKDRRFDVPTVGVATVEGLAAAGAGCLAVEAGGVILMEKEKVIAAADSAGIAVVGVGLGARA